MADTNMYVKKLPRNGKLKMSVLTARARRTVPFNMINKGTILAIRISQEAAGVISNCSSVPESFSFTKVTDETRLPVSVRTSPRTPGTKNHEEIKPGL